MSTFRERKNCSSAEAGSDSYEGLILVIPLAAACLSNTMLW